MTNQDRSGLLADSTTDSSDARPVVVHVCTSCRARGTEREPKHNRAGFKLYQNLSRFVEKSKLASQVCVQPTECLSLCPRPCGIALSSDDSWSYLFADQDPESSPSDILKCVSLYMEVAKGFMPRELRPASLRGSVVGRVPPMGRPSAKYKQPSEITTNQEITDE